MESNENREAKHKEKLKRDELLALLHEVEKLSYIQHRGDIESLAAMGTPFAAISRGYLRFNREEPKLSDEEKMQFLLDMVLFEVLKPEIDADIGKDVIKKIMVRVKSDKEEDAEKWEEKVVSKGRIIPLKLTPQQYINPTDTKERNQTVTEYLNENLDALIKRILPSKPQYTLAKQLAKIRKSPSAIQDILHEKSMIEEIPSQIQSSIDSYSKVLEKSLKNDFSKLNKTEKAKLLFIILENEPILKEIEAEIKRARSDLEQLKKQLKQLEKEQPKTVGQQENQASTKIAIENLEGKIRVAETKQANIRQFFRGIEPIKPVEEERKQLAAKYHFISSHIKQMIALSDLSQKKEGIYDQSFQDALQTHLNKDRLPRYTSESSSRFYSEIEKMLKKIDPDYKIEAQMEMPDERMVPLDDRTYRQQQLIKELEDYHTMREAEAALVSKSEEEQKEHHTTTLAFGLFKFGVSAHLKLKANEDVVRFLTSAFSPQATADPAAPDHNLGKLEIEALKKGRLGDILKKYNDVLPDQLRSDLGFKLSRKQPAPPMHP